MHSKKADLFVYGIYSKIINNEKHYIVLQTKYKTNAAYWLLIIFAAVGISFSSKEIGLPFDSLLTVILLSIIGMIGNLMFWYEDILFNERALNINYLEASKLEVSHHWLPQIHQHSCFPYKTMLALKNLFYIGCNLFFFFVMSFGILYYFLKFHLYLSVSILSISLLLFLIFSKFMFVRAYENELSNLKELLNDRR